MERDGQLIMVDDDRMRLKEGEKVETKKIRFRTLGCYPLTGGFESDAVTLDDIIKETLSAVESERTTSVNVFIYRMYLIKGEDISIVENESIRQESVFI